jgi:ATP adenylyltransferase
MDVDLRTRVSEATSRALAGGAIEPIASRVELVADGGATFIVRVAADPIDPSTTSLSPKSNPFLPYNPAVFVADLSVTHVCLLNKYSVVSGHVLLVTREYREQESLLDEHDFDAFFACLSQIDGLCFYNSGPAAGASQPHKHLQFVPFPLAAEGDAPRGAPLARLWEASNCQPGKIGSSRRLPFQHRLARLPAPDVDGAAQAALALYQQMLDELSLCRSGMPQPYNLLLTSPQTSEHYGLFAAFARGARVRAVGRPR